MTATKLRVLAAWHQQRAEEYTRAAQTTDNASVRDGLNEKSRFHHKIAEELLEMANAFDALLEAIN